MEKLLAGLNRTCLGRVVRTQFSECLRHLRVGFQLTESLETSGSVLIWFLGFVVLLTSLCYLIPRTRIAWNPLFFYVTPTGTNRFPEIIVKREIGSLSRLILKSIAPRHEASDTKPHVRTPDQRHLVYREVCARLGRNKGL